MKRVEIEMLIPKTVVKYEARDGRQFETSWACGDYERGLNEALLIDIETCPELNGWAPFDGEENMEYNSYRWFKPKNEDEIECLGIVFGEHNFCSADINHWLCVSHNDDDSVWVQMLDSAISYAKTLLDKLGYKMTVTKKESPNECM